MRQHTLLVHERFVDHAESTLCVYMSAWRTPQKVVHVHNFFQCPQCMYDLFTHLKSARHAQAICIKKEEKDIARLQRIENCLARVVTKAPRFNRTIPYLTLNDNQLNLHIWLTYLFG